MALRSIVLFSSIALSCLASLACSDSDGGTPSGAGGASGSGGSAQGTGGAPETCKVAPNASAPEVSFKDEVMPILGFGCSGSQCHSGSRPKADLFLGPKCDFKDGVCTYPTAPNTEKPDGPQPLTAEDIAKAYADLMEASATAPAVKRVAPSDPDNSFLIDKIAGIQNDKNLTCTNTDPTPGAAGPCGDWMPYIGGPLCATGKTAQETRVDVLVNWVAQGAKNN